MSEIVRTRVTAVATELSTETEVVTAVRVLREMVNTVMSARAQREFHRLTAHLPARTMQLVPTPRPIAPTTAVAASLSASEARQVSQLVHVAHLSVENASRLGQQLARLPVEQWSALIRASHQRLFTRSVTAALERACRRMGWPQVRKLEAGIIASDPTGRCLVADVSANGELAAEVVGVASPTCHLLIDRFLDALRREGVQSAVLARNPTGGRPSLPTARLLTAQAMSATRAQSHNQAPGRRIAPRSPAKQSRR